MGNWAKTGIACPCGKSSDAYATDVDGNGFCFSGACGKYFRNNKEEELDKSKFTLKPHEHRGIRESVFTKYGVQSKFFEDTFVETAFFYPNGSIKIRNMASKRFKWVGENTKIPMLFGKNVFDRGSKTVVTITEGEYDAMSVYQIIGDQSVAVSVRSSVTAKADCIGEFEYLNSFDKIIINFDSDDPGQEAAKKVASLFDFKKVYNLCLTKGKDANEYLENDMAKEYYEAWRGVKRYTPDSILSTMSEFRKALREKRGEKIVDYPFRGLQSKLYGLHEGEVVLIKALEGVGKTEMLRAIENKILKESGFNVGIIHLEESNGDTLRGMAGYYTETAVQSPDAPASDEEIEGILEKIVGENEDRFVLYSAFDVEDDDKFINNIRFMVSANDCKVVCFDHISWLAAGQEQDKESSERIKLDRISQRLKMLAEELRFCLVMISHVNDLGQTRGSRYISKAANTVIHITRNKTSEDETERTKLHFLVEKARLVGAKEGPAGFAIYDTETLMLIDPMDRGLTFE